MKRLLALLFLLVPAGVWAQTAALPVQQCIQPGTQAAVSGLISTNYQMGIVPSCTVTVYLTGTQTIATTTPQTPLTASPTGQFLIYAPINTGYDVVLSGGISPNTYPSPVTITNQFAGYGGTGCFNGGSIAQGCTGATTAATAATNIVDSNVVKPSSMVSGMIPNWNLLYFATPMQNPQITNPNPLPLASSITDGTVTSGSATISAPDANFTGAAGDLVVVEICPSSNNTCNRATITAWSCTGTTCTFTSNNLFVSGSTVVLYGFTSANAISYFNGQTVTVLSSGLSSTQFEAVISGAATNSNTETAYGANITSGFADFEGTILSGSGTSATVSSTVPFSLSGTATILWGQDVGPVLNTIQSTICTSFRFNGNRYNPTIYFPTGTYLDATPSEWECGNYMGQGNAAASSLIYWVGAAGAIPFYKLSTDTGVWSMEMMSLGTPSRNSNYPAVWFKNQTTTDETVKFENNHITNFSTAGLWLDADIANFHPMHNRWDDTGGPMYLYTVPSGGANQGSFSLTSDTVDMGFGSGTQNGDICSSSYITFDNTVGSANPLTFSWIGAQRLESECQLPSNFALISKIGGLKNDINYRLSDLTVQESLSRVPYSIFYTTLSTVGFGTNVLLANLKFDKSIAYFAESASDNIPISTQCSIGATYYISTCYPPVWPLYSQSNQVPDSEFKHPNTYWPSQDAVFTFTPGAGADGGPGWVYVGTGSAAGVHYVKSSTSYPINILNGQTVTLSGAIYGVNSTANPLWILADSVSGARYCSAVQTTTLTNYGYSGNEPVFCTYTNNTGSTVHVIVEASTGNATVTNGQNLIFSNPEVCVGFSICPYQINDFWQGGTVGNILPSTVLPPAPSSPGYGFFYTRADSNTTSQGTAVTQNTTRCYPFTWSGSVSGTYSTIEFKVATAETSGYTDDVGIVGPNFVAGATGIPLLAHTGGITTLTSTGYVSLPLAGAPVTLSMPSGIYAVCITSNGATPALLLDGDTAGSDWLIPFLNASAITDGTTTGGVLNSTYTAPALAPTASYNLWVYIY